MARSSPIAVIFLFACALGFLGGGIALYVTRNSGSRSGHEVGAGVFAGCALVMLVVAWYVYRRTAGGGPRTRGVELQLERTEFRRGEQVLVTVHVQSNGRQLEVGLVCTRFTDVKRQRSDQYGSHDYRATEPVDVVTDWRGVAAGTDLQSFTFTIPSDGPFSYEGAAVSFAYRVSAREPRRMRADPHRDVPIWVAP